MSAQSLSSAGALGHPAVDVQLMSTLRLRTSARRALGVPAGHALDAARALADGVRRDLIKNFEAHGLAWLQQEMQTLDPNHYKEIDQKNTHRLIRALEVKLATGYSIASFRKKNKVHHPFDIVKIGLELPRKDLYQRIDERMDKMIDSGLFQEAEKLYAYKHLQALQTVGYQEVFDFMDGNYDRTETIRLLKRNSRRYAKRQLTWFKRDAEIKWFPANDIDGIIDVILASIIDSRSIAAQDE